MAKRLYRSDGSVVPLANTQEWFPGTGIRVEVQQMTRHEFTYKVGGGPNIPVVAGSVPEGATLEIVETTTTVPVAFLVERDESESGEVDTYAALRVLIRENWKALRAKG